MNAAVSRTNSTAEHPEGACSFHSLARGAKRATTNRQDCRLELPKGARRGECRMHELKSMGVLERVR